MATSYIRTPQLTWLVLFSYPDLLFLLAVGSYVVRGTILDLGSTPPIWVYVFPWSVTLGICNMSFPPSPLCLGIYIETKKGLLERRPR